MRRARLLATTVALVAAVVACPASVAVAADVPSGVAVAPAVVEREQAERTVDLSFTVANSDPVPVRVDLTVRALRQTLDGAFDYGEPVATLAVQPAAALLAPGRRAVVRVTGTIPDGAPALYAALLAEPSRLDATPTGHVEIRTRLASLLLLTTPGAHRRAVEVADVTLTPTGEERTFRVGAVLRNVGDVHVRPQGTVRITAPDGRDLGTATLTGAVLLPGAARRLDGGVWTAPPEVRDTVRTDVVITDPAATGTRTISLKDAAQTPVAPVVVPGAGLGELGGNDGGTPWLVWLAAALLALMVALLAWHRLRRPLPRPQPESA